MFKVPVEKHGINGHLRQKGKVAEILDKKNLENAFDLKLSFISIPNKELPLIVTNEITC